MSGRPGGPAVGRAPVDVHHRRAGLVRPPRLLADLRRRVRQVGALLAGGEHAGERGGDDDPVLHQCHGCLAILPAGARRRSRKAEMPSAASSVPRLSESCAGEEAPSPGGSGQVLGGRERRACRARGPPGSSRASSGSERARRPVELGARAPPGSPGPSAAPRRAVSRSPVRTSSSARLRPTCRCSSAITIIGKSPTSISGVPSSAESTATARSQASTSPRPPPSACPLTRATVGRGEPASASSSAPYSRRSAWPARKPPLGHRPEVTAGGEDAVPRAGEHHHAHGRVRLGAGQRGPERLHHLRRERVARRRPVDGQERLTVFNLVPDRSFFHLASSGAARAPSQEQGGELLLRLGEQARTRAGRAAPSRSR